MAERLAAAPARLARRARRLYGYWRSERRTLRQGTAALALSTCAGFVAGLVLGSITGTLEKLPGLLVLIPASVGMRGTIFGAMGARFGTGIAAGIFEPTLRRGSLLSRNVVVGILSALLTSFYLAGVAKLVASAFAKGAVISFWDLVTISVVGGVLASLVALMFTVGIAVLSFRRGWDLDAVATPMVTAIGDMVTLPSLFLATLLVGNATVSAVAAGICTAATAAALIAAFRVEVRVRRILLEMVAVVALAPLLDIFAGALLEAHRGELQAVTAVLILIPPSSHRRGRLAGYSRPACRRSSNSASSPREVVPRSRPSSTASSSSSSGCWCSRRSAPRPGPCRPSWRALTQARSS